MTERVALWWTAAPEPMDLPATVAAVAGFFTAGATAFLSSPDDHTVAALVAGDLRTPAGPTEVDGVFAARIFNQDGELRWLHATAGLGDAVLITERAGAIDGWRDQPAGVVDRLPNAYALWGRQLQPLRSSTPPGWVRALEGRIGWIDVPLDEPAGHTPPDHEWPSHHISLRSVEYFGLDEHHNYRLVEERLTQLTLAQPTSGKGT